MLKDLGCSHVIIGHSERRQYFGETDEQVARKVKAAQTHGLIPIICVGETREERENGSTMTVITRQVQGALQGQTSDDVTSLVIAYEPVWAIGTGLTATPAQAQEVHAAIRSLLAGITNQHAAAAIRVLYGGSVKPDNIDGIMAQTDIDGALVGGASLQADSFARIVRFQ
jgi:triosephosphate isomerase